MTRGVREILGVSELAEAGAGDSLVLWAGQGLRRARAWRLGDAVAVAAPDISRRDDLAPLVSYVLGEVGPSYRPFGSEEVVRELAERVDGLEFVATFGWMDCAVAPPVRGAVEWIEDIDRVTALLEAAAPESYAWPGRPGVRAWAGVVEGGALVSVAADAWSAPEVGFIAGVATAPGVRGRGLSRAVCGFVTAELVTRCGRVALMVDSGNESAIAVYRRLGYTYRPVAAARHAAAVRSVRLGAC